MNIIQLSRNKMTKERREALQITIGIVATPLLSIPGCNFLQSPNSQFFVFFMSEHTNQISS